MSFILFEISREINISTRRHGGSNYLQPLIEANSSHYIKQIPKPVKANSQSCFDQLPIFIPRYWHEHLSQGFRPPQGGQGRPEYKRKVKSI